MKKGFITLGPVFKDYFIVLESSRLVPILLITIYVLLMKRLNKTESPVFVTLSLFFVTT